jgi:hypothetical protein
MLLAARELPRLLMSASSRRSRSASPPTTRVRSGSGSWRFRQTNHHGSARQTPRRHVEFRAMPTAPRDGQRSSARRYLPALETYASSSKRQGCRRSTALRPIWVRPWHVFSKLIPHRRLMQLWLTSMSPQPWWKRGARCPNLWHPHRAGIHAVDLIDLRTTNSPPSKRK